jgi:hypothetical protein
MATPQGRSLEQHKGLRVGSSPKRRIVEDISCIVTAVFTSQSLSGLTTIRICAECLAIVPVCNAIVFSLLQLFRTRMHLSDLCTVLHCWYQEAIIAKQNQDLQQLLQQLQGLQADVKAAHVRNEELQLGSKGKESHLHVPYM